MPIIAWLAGLTSNAGKPGNQDPDVASSRVLSRTQRRAARRFTFRDVRPTPVNIFCITMFYIGMINFMAFFAGALKLHGDALNGRIIDGHYMLSSHGHLHEVSPSVFHYSFWHGASVVITHPLAMLCIWHLQQDVAKHRVADA